MAFNQQLRAAELAPAAASWQTASDGDRRAFFSQAGDLAVREKRAELARAIGRNGRRMKARKHPRADGANGPVLTPHDDRSRTARLLAHKATAGGVTLFWHGGIRKGQKTPWGTILGFHAGGHVRGAPVRDVRLSKRGIGRVRAELARWWTNRQARQTRAAQKAANAQEQAAQDRILEKHRWMQRYFGKPGRGI